MVAQRTKLPLALSVGAKIPRDDAVTMLGEKGVHLARSPVAVSMCFQDDRPILWGRVPGSQFKAINCQQDDILVGDIQDGWCVIRRTL